MTVALWLWKKVNAEQMIALNIWFASCLRGHFLHLKDSDSTYEHVPILIHCIIVSVTIQNKI